MLTSTSHEKIKRTHSYKDEKRRVLEDDKITSFEVRKVLDGILDHRTSMALMTMSRLKERHRIKNIFTIALK
eukprot:scaffold79094_cov35-Cyclotella_meneghiniana.AAC.3